MKTTFSILIVAVIVALGAGAWLQRLAPPTSTQPAKAIWEALAAFEDSHQAKGLPLPSSVSLSTLTNQGFLDIAECGPFAGLDVTISLVADERRPQDVLMQVRYPDGTATVTLADGSVQSIPAERAAALPR